MSSINYNSSKSIGKVISVDTASIIVEVEDLDKLKSTQVNHLSVIQSPKAGQHLIGLIKKITRKSIIDETEASDEEKSTENLVRISLIGTLLDKYGTKLNVFKRTLETVPEIDAECYVLTGPELTSFMETIASNSTDDETPLTLGTYTLDQNAKAYIDGDKLFQRHACIVGSTGSGKSWCVARLIEQIAKLKSANSILFDVHGEYKPLESNEISYLKVMGPGDMEVEDPLANGLIKLPYWLLTYEEMLSMCLDRSDSNAPNQAMLFAKQVSEKKLAFLHANRLESYKAHFTVDSPIPYDINLVLDGLRSLDVEMVTGSSGREKQGPYHGKLTRFIQRLEAKIIDRRLGFLFNTSTVDQNFDYLNEVLGKLLNAGSNNSGKGVKILDFSEVPSDILPLMTGLLARLIFMVQQWTDKDKRQPVSLFCDEAHLYIPQTTNSSQELGLKSFERIAKEGRKYGTGLVIISQRPSEVNRTVISQCNNFISLRLSNQDDQSVIKKLLPDSLGDLTELLPVLDIAEALIVGDCTLLPIRISIDEPINKPSSATIDFWTEWTKGTMESGIDESIDYLRKQSKSKSTGS